MRNLTKPIATFWTMLLLVVMLMGSPLAGFGCQTIVPSQFQVPCETILLEAAVQSNHIQPITPTIAVFVMLTVICWLKPRHQTPQEIHLLPPLPPPRSFV